MVRKVLRYPGVISINSQGLGLVELPNVPRPLLALDLTHFLDQRQGSFSWSQAFLLLIEPSAENIMAVPIPTLPTLVDVPLGSISPLPVALQQDPAYRFIGHTALLPPENTRLYLIGLGIQNLVSSPKQIPYSSSV
ncbi:MAG: hypothetical protein Q6K99_08065 [Thermostichales cyanobacterium BF4_bins_65]